MKNKAIINLGYIRQNAYSVRKMIGDKLFMAVVKDDGYGHGGVEVAQAIYNIVDCYAVSLVEEGKALRLSGIDKSILVLIPCDKKDLEDAIYFDLTLSVFSLLQLKQVELIAKKLSKKVNVHIQFDSGMNRCGTSSLLEIEEICLFCKKSEYINITGIYSHLGSPKEKRKTKKQVDKFLLAIKTVKVYNNNIITHISASGGLISNNIFDMVRVGIMLYGYLPFKCNIKLLPAMKIIVPVIKEVDLKPFNHALYGLKVSFRKRKLALIRLGYGDGLSRKKVKNQFSNKCMDLSLVDFNKTKRGYYIIDNFEEFAKKYHTISYEIMVSISKRCERIYKDS